MSRTFSIRVSNIWFSFHSGDEGDEEWPCVDPTTIDGEADGLKNSDMPMSPTPRPPSAGSQPKSPRARRQRTLSQSTVSKAAITTTSQVGNLFS